MKKIAILLALVMLALPLAACGVKEEAAPIPAQDMAAMEAAAAAYESGMADCLLYETDGRFVALREGAAIGVYDSREAALGALFDDPETEENEADGCISVAMTGTAWYICRENFKQYTYVAFGDSITYGIDGHYRVGDPAYRMPKPYPTLVEEILGLRSVRNLAVSGASFCPCDGRTNMTSNILGFGGEADIISLMLGVNDFSSALPLGEPTDRDNTTVYGCLYLISEHFTTLYPDAFIFYMTPFQYVRTHNGVYSLEDVATAIKTVAAAYDIPVLDMYTCGGFEKEMYVSPSDGLHPSQQHHMYYTAPLICEFLARHCDK